MAQTLVIGVGDAADRLRPLMEERIQRLKIGPGLDPDVDMGPIYSAEHRAAIVEWIDKGVAEGAELVADGRRFSRPDHPDGFFLGATLRPRHACDGDLPGGDLRAGPGYRPGGDLRRGARARQRPPVWQWDGDLHH